MHMSVRFSPPLAARPDALPEIVDLLERVVPRDRPWGPDVEWQYVRNPCGPVRYVNAYADGGRLLAHYAVAPTPALADPPAAFGGTYFSLNTVVDPAAGVPGLMVATGRALFRQLEAEGPSLVLGVANENSFQGFVRMLGFRSLGRLALTAHLPGTFPKAAVPRALGPDPAYLDWRASRPGVVTFGHAARGALTVRLHHHGMPIDAVLTVGLGPEQIRDLGLPAAGPWVPRLYAASGASRVGGVPVPDRWRPSPLEYIVRVPGDPALTEVVARHLASRRFEFFDFDVV
jgi:hypothetical protein